MTVKKSFFSRTTAFVTAFLMALMTIMTIPINSSALYLGDDGDYYLDNNDVDVRSIVLQVVDKDGKVKYTLGNGMEGLIWEEGDHISMSFEWELGEGEYVQPNDDGKLALDRDIFEQLKSGTLLRYDLGPVEGLFFDESIIPTPEKAQYWITNENGHVYINIDLTEDYAHADGNAELGGYCWFEGTLDFEEEPEGEFEVSIPDIGIECTFDFTPNPTELHVFKSAVGSVCYDEENDCYYQEFEVRVGSFYADVENVYLEDYLGDAFEGIYDVEVNGEEVGYDADYIYVGDIRKSDAYDTTWDYTGSGLTNPAVIKYKAKLKNGYSVTDLLGKDLDGENTIIAYGDDVDPDEATAEMVVLPPEITKSGSLSNDKSSITWIITVKSNILTGSDFTIEELFDEIAKEYLDLEDFYNEYPDGEIRVENASDGIYTIYITTPVKQQPNSSVTVRNDINVTFDDYPGVSYPGGDDVNIPVSVGVGKEYIGREDNTFEWEIKVSIPNDNTVNKIIIKDEPFYDWQYYEQKMITSISKGDITITGSDGTVLKNFNFSYSQYEGATIEITDSAFIKANIGETITINCKTFVDDDKKEVTYINNKVTATVETSGNNTYAPDEDTAEYEKKYTTEKYAKELDGAFAPTRWLVRISSIEGFKAGDVVNVEDIIPAGYEFVKGSLKAGYMLPWQGSNEDMYNFTDSSWGGNELDPKADTVGNPVTVDGGTKYTFTFTIPEGWAYEGDKSIWVGITYETKLTAAEYADVLVNGEKKYTNNATATVNGEGSNRASADRIAVSNAVGILVKESDADSKEFDANNTFVEYTLKINPEAIDIDPTSNKITVYDTAGIKLTPRLESIRVLDITNGGIDVTDYGFNYDSNLNRMTFILNDNTYYVITYTSDVLFPSKNDYANGNYDSQDYENLAEIIIADRNSVGSSTTSGWVTGLFGGGVSSSDTTKYVDLTVQKLWGDKGITDLDVTHQIKLVLEWEKFNYNGTTTGESGTTNYYFEANEKTRTEYDLPGKLLISDGYSYYYVYKLKEVAVDGEKLEDSNLYQVQYGTDAENANEKLKYLTIDRNTPDETTMKITNLPASVKISKQDLLGSEVEGAEIEITAVSPDAKIICLDPETEKLTEEKSISWISEKGKSKEIRLTAGTYTLKEVTAPFGYQIVETEVTFTVTIDADGKAQVTLDNVSTEGSGFYNDASDSSKVIIKDEPIKFKISKTAIDDTTEELEGAKINLYLELTNGDTKPLDSWTTVKTADGELNSHEIDLADKLSSIISGLSDREKAALRDADGKYTFILEEVSAPEGYEKLTTTYKFKVDKNGKITDVEESEYIEGEDDLVILKNKALTVKLIKQYKNKEGKAITPSDAVLAATKFALFSDSACENKISDDVQVTKGTGDDAGKYVVIFETLSDGGKLVPGTYYLKETGRPAGYEENKTVVTCRISTSGEVTYNGSKDFPVWVNIKDQTQITLSKTDIITGDEVDGATITIYKVNEDGELEEVETWISGESETGGFTIEEPGTYVLKETTAPDGYGIVETEVEFTVDENGTVTFTGTYDSDGEIEVNEDDGSVIFKDKAIKFSIDKTDITGAKELEGAELELYVVGRDEPIDSWTSGTEAHEIDLSAFMEELKGTRDDDGSYTFKIVEKAAPNGYTVTTDITFTVDKFGEIKDVSSKTTGAVSTKTNADGTTTVVVKDDAIKVKISKSDITGAKELAGAELELYVVGQDEPIATWISETSAHEIDLSDLLEGFEDALYDSEGTYTFKLVEKAAPNGYTVTTEITFTVDKYGKVQKVTSETDGAVEKTKNDDGIIVKDDAIKFNISKSDLTGEKELAGAQLELYVDGQEKPIDSWKSETSAHEIDLSKLLEGFDDALYDSKGEYTFKIVEKAAPNGYTVTTEITFTVDQNGNIKNVTSDTTGAVSTKKNADGTTTIVVKDDAIKFKISKRDLTGENELAGADLELYVDGQEEPIASWTSGTEAHDIDLSDLLKGIDEALYDSKGEYTFKIVEKAAPQGYTVTTEITFTVDQDGNIKNVTSDTTGAVSTKTNDDGTTTIIIKDDTAKFHVSKKALTGEDELAGAELELYVDGQEKPIASWTSGTEVHDIDLWELLKDMDDMRDSEGNYTFKLVEKAAPNGYTVTTDITFTVDKFGNVKNVTSDTTGAVETKVNDDGTTTIVVKDDTIRFSISKTDITGEKELEGAEIELYVEGRDEPIASWISETSAHEIDLAELLKDIEDVLYDNEGTYTFKIVEKTAPNGYGVTTDITFTVDKFGKVDNVSSETDGAFDTVTNDDGTTTIIVKDNKIQDIKLIKTFTDNGSDVVDTSLTATFGLYRDADLTDLVAIKPAVWGEDGQATVSFSYDEDGIEIEKTYYMKEESAPSGYRLNVNVYVCRVNRDGSVDYKVATADDAMFSSKFPECVNYKISSNVPYNPSVPEETPEPQGPSEKTPDEEEDVSSASGISGKEDELYSSDNTSSATVIAFMAVIAAIAGSVLRRRQK